MKELKNAQTLKLQEETHVSEIYAVNCAVSDAPNIRVLLCESEAGRTRR